MSMKEFWIYLTIFVGFATLTIGLLMLLGVVG